MTRPWLVSVAVRTLAGLAVLLTFTLSEVIGRFRDWPDVAGAAFGATSSALLAWLILTGPRRG